MQHSTAHSIIFYCFQPPDTETNKLLCPHHKSTGLKSGSAQPQLNTLEMTCSTVDPHRMSSIGCKLLAAQHINIKYSGSTQSHLNLIFYLERPYRYRHTSRSNTVDQYHLDSILQKRSTQDEIHTWKCIFDEHGLQSHAQISKYNGHLFLAKLGG